MIDEDDDDQKNAPPPVNRLSGTISFNRSKKKIGLQSRNLEQVRRRPKRPNKNPSKESTLENMLKKRRG